MGWSLTNKLGGEASDFMAVQHVESPQAVDHLPREPAHGYRDQLAAELFGDLPPSSLGRNRRDKGHVRFSCMHCSGGNQTFLKCLRQIQAPHRSRYQESDEEGR